MKNDNFVILIPRNKIQQKPTQFTPNSKNVLMKVTPQYRRNGPK